LSLHPYPHFVRVIATRKRLGPPTPSTVAATGSSRIQARRWSRHLRAICRSDADRHGRDIRHSIFGAAEFLGRPHRRPTLINAERRKHEQPTQALLDLLTIRDKHGKIESLKVCLVAMYSLARRPSNSGA